MDPHLAAGLRSALRGAAGWGTVGAGLGALNATPDNQDPGAPVHRGRSALKGALGGAAFGGLLHGAHALASPAVRRLPQAPLHDVAPWLKDVKTQQEAKAAYRGQARANHPDTGGSHTRMQDINNQWAAAKSHPAFEKLNAFYSAGQDAALLRFFDSYAQDTR